MLGQIINCPRCSLSLVLKLRGSPSRKDHPPKPLATGEAPDCLPIFTADSLRSMPAQSSDGTTVYTVNLLDYTCTCPAYVEVHSKALPFTFGRMCKHICAARRIAHDLNGNLIYITGASASGWLNVFALPRRNGKTYKRFGYSVNEARWAYGVKPPIDESILPVQICPESGPGRKVGMMFLSGFWEVLKFILFIAGAVIACAFVILNFILSSGKRRRRRW